jgi:5S rRNA maturation endonuclease (ribonuclease M5)
VNVSRASNTTLDTLHGLLAEAQTEELRRAIERAREPVMIADPDNAGKKIRNPLYEPLSPKLIAVAIKFLKDNGIDAPANSPRFSPLLDELKKLDVDDPTLLAH